MPRYPNNQPSPNRPSPPGELDDRKRGSAYYYPEDQLYSPTDQNGSQRSPVRNTGGTGEGRIPPSQTGQLQHQQRIPVEQSRPPVTNKAPLSRGAANIHTSQRPLPRDRNGPPSPAKTRPESPEPASPTAPDLSQQNPGDNIPRLNSPSVAMSVLKPLDAKVHEYGAQMHLAQNQMAQLDAEIAAFQERRREAENRYMAAKTKHDDYRRQYQGVERALRAESDMFPQSNLEDERPLTRQTENASPPQTPGANSNTRTESWGSLKKPKNDSRFRISKLFSSA